MLTPYRALFAAPGTLSFVTAGLLARMALPMTGIGIITMLAQLRGSYALAGMISSTFILAYALSSPHVSRLADRHGQRAVLPAAAALSITGMLLIAAATWRQGPDWILLSGAALAGCMPSMSAMARARWASIHPDPQRLQTAYALETVLDEITFIAGPPLAVMLSITLTPQAGLLGAALLLASGVAVMTMQRKTIPAVATPAGSNGRQGSAIRLTSIQLLSALMAAMGMIVGTIDIASVAFAAEQGKPAAASLILSTYAAGSCLAGLLFGANRLPLPLPRLLLLGGLATAASTLPLTLASNLPALAIAVLLAGMLFAPTMIVAMALVAQQVPAHRLTEGMTWLLAGLNLGVAAGAAMTGHMVARHGASPGFSVALYAGALVLLIARWASSRPHTGDVSARHAT